MLDRTYSNYSDQGSLTNDENSLSPEDQDKPESEGIKGYGNNRGSRKAIALN